MMHTLIRFTVLILGFSLGNGSTLADNIDPNNDGTKYAYGENVGWINFKPAYGPGGTVTDSAFNGYAWGENVGWVNLSPANGGIINDGAGNLSGYAWGENVGWINFSPTGAGVTIDPATGTFNGRAWGENIGWISFASTSAVAFGVTTSWRGDSDEDGVKDDQDAFPIDPDEWLDTDGDGKGNNADTDDDNDGMPDVWEANHGLDPLDPDDADDDPDKDGHTNLQEYLSNTDPNKKPFPWELFIPAITKQKK
jgi:hypothetical protein